MASIQRKIIHGRPYYSLVESRRVNGRPRPVVLQYLGSADSLLQRLQHQQLTPTRARLSHFGGVAALYDLAQQLHLVELIDQHAPKRRQGPSLGQYLLVAAINRCLEPTSKLQMPAWLRSTPLPRWLGATPQQFSAQRFWDNMELLGEKPIAAISEALTQRYQALARDCQSITLVFDKGNNSARNQEILDGSGFHFVGSLVPTHFADLLALPVEKFQPLKDPRLKPTRALRLTRQVWEQERTLLLTFSPELQRKQIRGIQQHLTKKRRALEELQAKLRRSQKPGAKGKGYSQESLWKQVEKICSGQHIAKILQVAVSKVRSQRQLSYRTDASAFSRIKQQHLGKRILFTDQHSWSNEQIVLAYRRSQSQVEDSKIRMQIRQECGLAPRRRLLRSSTSWIKAELTWPPSLVCCRRHCHPQQGQ